MPQAGPRTRSRARGSTPLGGRTTWRGRRLERSFRSPWFQGLAPPEDGSPHRTDAQATQASTCTAPERATRGAGARGRSEPLLAGKGERWLRAQRSGRVPVPIFSLARLDLRPISGGAGSSGSFKGQCGYQTLVDGHEGGSYFGSQSAARTLRPSKRPLHELTARSINSGKGARSPCKLDSTTKAGIRQGA